MFFRNVARFCRLTAVLAVSVIPEITWGARPLSTEDTGTVPARQVDLEAGWDLVGKPCPEHAGGITLKSGLNERVDIGFTVPFSIKPNTSVDELGISSKLAVVPGVLAAAFALCTAEGEYTAVAVLDVPAGPIAVHLNGGVAAGGVGITASGLAGIAIDIPVSGTFSLAAETFGYGAPLNRIDGLCALRCRIRAIGIIDLGGGVTNESGEGHGHWTAGLTKSF